MASYLEVEDSIKLGVFAAMVQNGLDTVNDITGLVESLFGDRGYKHLTRDQQIEDVIDYLASYAPNQATFYTGKFITDLVMVAVGIYGTAVGLQIFGAGLGSEALSTIALVPTLGEPALAMAGSAAVTAVGAVTVGVSLDLALNAGQNAIDDFESLKKSVSNGTGQSERTFNVNKQESEVYNSFDKVKGQDRRTSGSGSKKQYYEWDHTHNDIEVYNSKGKHLGAMDPVTGEMYKGPVKGRSIDI